MQSRLSWNVIAIWFVASALAVLACSLNLSAARLGEEYVPIGNDSFYHARRILDTAREPSAFYEFDPSIHAPEGSLLNWPWGYDYALAWIVRAGVAAGISSEPLAILMWIPVAAVTISLALLVLIARQLGLSNWLTTLGALCMALAPGTQLLHGVGQIDHHFAEMILLLASIAAGLGWLRSPESRLRAASLAAVLGVAPAIHNGLFILQVPFLATLLAFWLQKKSLPRRTSILFAVVLVVTTLAVSIPSLPLRMGRFEFYTLSWFHPYVAVCTAAATLLMSWLKPTRAGIGALLAAGFALLIPVLGQMELAGTFLTGANQYLAQIGEMQSPAQFALRRSIVFVTRMYSYLIYLAPLTALLCVVQCWRERGSPRLLFWLTALLGLTLLSLQLRLHYFGNFALYLPWLVIAQEFAAARPHLHKKIYLMLTVVVLLLYASVLRYQLIAPMPRANDMSFENVRPIFARLREACAEDPGIVLADANAGHYIRYYTDCPVIANNFLLTPQHFQKVGEVGRLFSLSAAQLLQQVPHVKYVLVRPFDLRQTGEQKVAYRFFYEGRQQLARDLLLGQSSLLPPNYILLHEIRFAELNDAPYARLYRIRSRSQLGTSPNDAGK